MIEPLPTVVDIRCISAQNHGVMLASNRMPRLLIVLTFLLFPLQVITQDTHLQTGHTHDILEVRFSPDDSQLASYSAGDGRFILWVYKAADRSGREKRASFAKPRNEPTSQNFIGARMARRWLPRA